ncbi:integrin alpha-PS1 isoform X2 [Planococcus citri]|uniref:integrin alpha-PS1 isoform X2 n=1 Tax=Planococcus citri TaxID=170843 RepID=UPI0031F85044
MVFCALSKNNHAGVLIFILTNGVLFAHGFNLETRLPSVKQGHNGSYFGYSVAAHQIHDEDGRITDRLMLVGAPLDKNLQPQTTKSGALWRCPLTNDRNDCIQVITDGRREVDNDELSPPNSDEVKDGQWLGVTVKSQGPGEKVLVCAHRYVSGNFSCRGLCYILKQDLELEKHSEPCQSLQVGHTKFGSCQSGTSGMIFEDDNVVIGAPGALNWRGAVTILNVNDDPRRDKEVFTGPTDSWNEINPYGYLGMSVTGGYFLGDNISVFAAGAPRGNETGQVVLFVKRQSTGPKDKWIRYLIINGEQIASNFGYQVAAADLNGDKLSDLIVAAPFYFNLKTEEGGAVYIYMNDPVYHLNRSVPVKLTGKLESRFGLAISSLGDLNRDGCDDLAVGAPYEGNGVVYIYLGSRNGLITKPSQIIKSETIYNRYPLYTTFGYSLSGGVDLDGNGYPDLLIGAYENDTVVLLRSRPIIGFTTKVQPEYNLTNIDPNVRNCLINNTNYISCFSFETCCTITSVVQPYTNRNLRIQFQLEAESFEGKTSRIWFDDFYKKDHIITKELIMNNKTEHCDRHTAYLKENTLDIQSPIKIRMSYKLIHREPEQSSGRDLLSLDDYPILNQQEADKVFEATFLKDCGSNDICESRINLTANLLLDQLGIKDSDPNMYQLALGERKSLIMNVTINNSGESAYQAQLFVQFPKQVTYNQAYLINDKDRYICHSKLDTYVVCSLGNPLKQSAHLDLQIEFDLENVNGSEPLLEFNITANTTSNDRNAASNNLKFKVRVVEKLQLSINGYSIPEEIPEMQNTELKGESAIEYVEEIGNKVIHYYTIYNYGTWNVSNLRVEFEWPYQVANDKKEGKWLLYLDEHPVVENAIGQCDISPNDVNPLKKLTGRPEELTAANFSSTKNIFPVGDKSGFNEKTESSSNAKYNRVKRDTEMTVTPETYYKDGKKYKIVKMNCILKTVKCLKFSCELNLIESKQFASIIIKSRLWDATLIEDYSDVDLIKISSRAKMHIPSSSVTLQNIYSDEFLVETSARVNIRGQQTPESIPLYYIIGAILIGLLMFILLTLLLWKLGFFKRRRPDPTLSGNLEKHRLDD